MSTSPVRTFLAAGSACLAVLLPATTASAASSGSAPGPARPAIPTARAYEKNGRPMKSMRPVLKYCRTKRGACQFTLDKGHLPLQFFSTVKSVGNAVINCTKSDITVDRRVDLQTGSQDNIGGEITGSIALEGQINVSGEISAGVSGEGGITFKTPNMKDGPMSETTAKGGAQGSGKVGASLSAKAAFQMAFKAQYQHSWTTTQTESTTYHMTVKPGDALVFGASAAMQRMAGTLTTNQGQAVRNVIVESPSTVNSSSFIANTFTAPGDTCDRLRPSGNTAATP
ncbi:hypothetical protein OG840_20040 [Streptomyces sp. NBC_01764]|uniref:hypothetical protein n=1 Tax=Streptomyces sp. NBC_01764 TaxID=2975935 RepID=UPI0022528E4D|nr:hypothetical protein [Streptomyces sp. NBC_01764]MCX4403978.1 hypothetical protein [Streptomyces sp. NBC_01764]